MSHACELITVPTSQAADMPEGNSSASPAQAGAQPGDKAAQRASSSLKLDSRLRGEDGKSWRQRGAQMRRGIAAFIMAACTVAATPAAARGLCVDREFSDSIRFDITIGWDKPNPLDPNPAPPIVPNPDEDAFLEKIRELGVKGWRTPGFVWPDTAVQVKIYDRGVLRCQVVYTSADLFVQDDDLDGFVTRPIGPVFQGQLDNALGVR